MDAAYDVTEDAYYVAEPEQQIVVVREEEPEVIYEQVVYETETVYQWVPYGHVHHIPTHRKVFEFFQHNFLPRP